LRGLIEVEQDIHTPPDNVYVQTNKFKLKMNKFKQTLTSGKSVKLLVKVAGPKKKAKEGAPMRMIATKVAQTLSPRNISG